jgi:hypothetical protein
MKKVNMLNTKNMTVRSIRDIPKMVVGLVVAGIISAFTIKSLKKRLKERFNLTNSEIDSVLESNKEEILEILVAKKNIHKRKRGGTKHGK